MSSQGLESRGVLRTIYIHVSTCFTISNHVGTCLFFCFFYCIYRTLFYLLSVYAVRIKTDIAICCCIRYNTLKRVLNRLKGFRSSVLFTSGCGERRVLT